MSDSVRHSRFVYFFFVLLCCAITPAQAQSPSADKSACFEAYENGHYREAATICVDHATEARLKAEQDTLAETGDPRNILSVSYDLLMNRYPYAMAEEHLNAIERGGDTAFSACYFYFVMYYERESFDPRHKIAKYATIISDAKSYVTQLDKSYPGVEASAHRYFETDVAHGGHQHGYPSRPRGVRIAYETGILMDYTTLSDGGGMTIRLRDGTEDYFMIAHPTEINGHRYRCDTLPYVGLPADLFHCEEKLKNIIVVGKTRVRVAYWRGSKYGRKVSDEIWTDPR